MNIFEMLVEYGMAGIFIAYMIWQDSANSKKAESQLAKFDAQLDKIREKQRADERSLRDRYDSVIEKYDAERDDLKLEVMSLIKDSSNQIENFHKSLEQFSVQLKSQNFLIEDQSRSLEKNGDSIKSILASVESCLKLIQDMISDQKIRDAASAAAKSQFSYTNRKKD